MEKVGEAVCLVQYFFCGYSVQLLLSCLEVNIGRAPMGCDGCPHSIRINASIVGRTSSAHSQHTPRSFTVAFSEFLKQSRHQPRACMEVNLFCDSVC